MSFGKSIQIGALLLGLTLAGCDSGGEDPVAYRVQVGDGADAQFFRIRLATDAQREAADSLAASGSRTIVYGTLRRGDGGFNAPYSWHMEPGSVSFPDVTIELCDGRPQFVEEDLDYWIDTVGDFCPWNARVLARAE